MTFAAKELDEKMTRAKKKKNSYLLFKKGDLIIDRDVFGDNLSDLALVLETPEDRGRDPKLGHYKIYYCTGPVAGDIVLESPYAMSQFKKVTLKKV